MTFDINNEKAVKKMKKVFVIGGVSFDTVIHLDEFPQPVAQTIHHCQQVFEVVGSTGAGKAASLAKLGVDVTLQGVIGEDSYGEKIKRFCREHGIDFKADLDPKGTDRHVNVMNDDGQRISIFIAETSVQPHINFNKYEEIIKNYDLIVLNIINYCRDFIPLIKQHNKEIWCDLHDYNVGNPYHQDFIEAADYIFLSSDNLKDYKKTMRELIAKEKKLVVCTHGKNGASALDNNLEWYDVPAISNYERIDTNGAGDNFFAGFLYGYKKGYSIDACLKYGAVVGGLCVSSQQIVNEKLSVKVIENEYQKYFN